MTMNVFSGRPIKFQDRDIRADDLRAAMVNLKHAAEEVFGNKKIDDVSIEGFENKNGINIRSLEVYFTVESRGLRRRKFIDDWVMPTSDDRGDIHLDKVPIGFRFAQPQGVN